MTLITRTGPGIHNDLDEYLLDNLTDILPEKRPKLRYPDIMLDLETLDTTPRAAILSIGAVAFDLNKPETVKDYLYGQDCTARSFEAVVELDAQSRHYDRTMSADTIFWWMKQSEEARKALDKKGAMSLPSALWEFYDWAHAVKKNVEGEIRLWGNGAAFDNAILRDAYAVCEADHPISFRRDMCYRTMKAMFMPGKVEVPDQNLLTAHNARHDAIFQAVVLQKIWANYCAMHQFWNDTHVTKNV